MSRVKDLEIRGVRNFGDESSKARIHFSRPLTLILGPNGTGKTTIIESLKYVTSGEYPPDSDKGKHFIHEPKLTQNHSVRGQVKARIIDPRGREVICTRTMQVTRLKTGNMKFQSLDNTITRLHPETKEKIQLTSRCADIDREMLITMGVSKPILNYVVFCHQEESNWPLEGGKQLKERFDEIFDTSQYNKAMDTMTKLIKELTSELNVIRAKEEGLKSIVEEVVSQEKKLENSERREQEAKDRINEIDLVIQPIDERIEEILKAQKQYTVLEDKKNKIETEYKMTKNYIESLKKHIKEIHVGSKEELVQRLETYDQNLTQKFVKKNKFEEDLQALEKNIKNLTLKLADTRMQLGSLTQKKIAFDEKVVRRNELLSNALKTWDIIQIDPSFEEKGVEEYISKIKDKSQEFNITMKNKIQENEQEERHMQREVDSQRTEKTEIDSEMSLKEKEREEIKQKIKEIKQKMGETKEACNKLASIESNRQIYDKKYEDLKKNFDEDAVKENIQKDIDSKKAFDVKLNQIDQEINSLHQQSSQQAELELHQKRLKEKDQLILSLKDKHKSNLNLLFSGKELPQKNLKHELEIIQKSLNNEKNNLLKQIETEQKKLTSLQTTFKYKKNELSNITTELNRLKQKLALECQDNDFDEILKLQQKKVQSLQDEKAIYSSQSSMYNKFIKRMKAKSCCPLCDRKFGNSSEEKQLETKLLSEIESSPQNLKECENNLKIEQKRYDALQQLKPVTEQISKFENDDLPKIRQSLEKIKSDIETSEENLETLKMVMLEPDEKINIYKSIVGDMSLLDSHISEYDNLNRLIEIKKCEMLKAGKIGDRNMKEAQNEREAIKKRLCSLEEKIQHSQSKLQEHQEKLQLLREQRNKYDEEVIKIRQDEQALNELKSKTKELYARDESLEKSMRLLRQKLVVAEEELSKRIEEFDSMKKKHRDEHEKNSSFKSRSTTEFHELQSVQCEVEKYLNNKIEENLKKAEARVEELTKQSEEKKFEISKLEESIRFLDDQCRTQETGKKDLESNLELIKKLENKKVLEEQLYEYHQSLKNMQYEELRKEYTSLQEKKDRLDREKSEIKGASSELHGSIKQLKKNLNQEKYRMARKNHKRHTIKITVQEEAVANLKTYVKVLDKAMIQFHEERMNTVNKIMHQLWNLVYSGSDTSSIQIRVQTTEGIGDKKRSYNYKLVQVKRSIEMDMKGKCSAGQKVLASIIIRMALAETFCSDCAILALDEPTTNLDEENAKNLAVCLSKVIQLRAAHSKNFQLIVISHDENFISHLSTLSGKQVFQELYRNREGYSMVRQRDNSLYGKNTTIPQEETFENVNSDSEEEEKEEEEEVGFRNSKKRRLELDSPPRSHKRRH